MRTLYRVQKSGYVVTVCPQSKCLSAFAGEIASTKTCDVSLGFQAKEKPAEQGFMRLRGDFVTESQVVEGSKRIYEIQSSEAMKKREVAIFLHDLKLGHPNRTKRLVVAYDGAGNALIRHKGRLVHPWTLPDFDAVLPLSDASFAVEISPPGQLVFGIESGEMLAISRNGRTYTAPIDKVYATLQRWHAKEHPSGKKRRKQLFSSSEEEVRLEKDMIATAKFAIKAGAISSPVFVTLAQNAFKIARHAKEHPTGKRRRRLFTSSEQMRKYRMEHQGGL